MKPQERRKVRRKMKIKVLSRRRNDLLKRRELTFEVFHEKGGTPSRLEVREKLAGTLSANADTVYIKKMETKTGSTITLGEANVYDSLEQAEYAEPDHIISRNMPKEEREEGM